MNPPDPRTQAVIDAALGHIASTASSAATRLLELLGGRGSAAAPLAQRDTLLSAQADLRFRLPAFRRNFDDCLRERVMQALAPRQESRNELASAGWESLSLVEDDEVDERMFADRIGQTIAHECESELRDLAAYMGALLRLGCADQERNPLRPEVIGAALYRAIEAVTVERDARKLLARELGPLVAEGMRLCYAEIVSTLKARGVEPVQLSVRGVEGPGNSRVSTGHATLPRDSGPSSGSPGSHFATSGAGAPSGAAAIADAELMSLIRRLSFVGSRSGAVDGAASAAAVGASPGTAPALSAPGALGGGLRGEGLTGLMAVNLIHAHRDQLRQASSGGTLDHMVIDVVGSLFDQILSDSRVSPQMARQIARLQLPVLRVALGDPSFFSSRKHPVRRFVNRIASLACAFDDFADGPGRHFLARVGELVQEIIEGDFDQVEVYAAKLTLLEAFIEQQTEGDVQANGAAASLLDGKESELRVQQRYMQQLRTALAPLALPDYLRDFLSQVWSQALAFAIRRDGPTAERTQRLRRAASELVLSVQPKGTPALRKVFLMQLPGLMKTLTEGLTLIAWPQTAQKDFFGKLLPAHAESLNGQAPSELDRNLLARQLDTIFNLPLPSADAALPGLAAPALESAALAPHFSAEEVARVGLVDENTVDWNGRVDALPDADAIDSAGDTGPVAALDLGVDIDLSVAAADPAEPSHGPQLMDHLQVGFAYQMQLKEQWQKVRMSYVSQGRSFFVFTHGRRHQETLSLTSRMLARMCEAGRLRAFESSYLLERATARARKQLAALRPAKPLH